MAISTTAFPFTSQVTYDELGWPIMDRAVDSTVLRNLIRRYFSNGVFLSADENCWKVTAPVDSSQTVNIAIGCGLIQGATGYTDKSDILALPDADGTLPRIDTVVARLNDNNDFRNIYLDVITGTPATMPVAPPLTQTDSVWEIGLADLYRPAHSITITQAQITDTRADSSRCGQVNAIDRIDTSGWFDQLNAYYAEFQQTCEDDYAAYTTRCAEIIADLATYEGKMESGFLTWFDHIKGQLDEDVAVHLQMEMDAKLDADGGDASSTIVEFTESEELAEINSGESQSTLFGKLKWAVKSSLIGFINDDVSFNSDGSITEKLDIGTKETVFNDDGSITETLTDHEGNKVIKTTVFNADGSITSTVSNR